MHDCAQYNEDMAAAIEIIESDAERTPTGIPLDEPFEVKLTLRQVFAAVMGMTMFDHETAHRPALLGDKAEETIAVFGSAAKTLELAADEFAALHGVTA